MMIANLTRSSECATTAPASAVVGPFISIGILARNEEEAIGPMLESLFRQSLFKELAERNLRCEIICVANGCNDNTASVSAQLFAAHGKSHPYRRSFSSLTLDLKERGKSKAWNLFVHSYASKASAFLFLMDADIVLQKPNTLWNMYTELNENPEAHVAVDEPIKDIALKSCKSLRDRISLAASRMTRAGGAQLTGQLYCIRASIARRIYLPQDLLVEDGFIKVVVCTDFLTRPSWPGRIVLAKDAAHVFQAYTSVKDIFKNQKRQMIAQTITHILVDNHLQALPACGKLRLADMVKEMEMADPAWLKQFIADHLHATRHCWRLFPNILTFRFKRLAQLRGVKRMVCLPAALIGWCLMLIGCWMARRSLKQGCLDYWPDTKSLRLRELGDWPGAAGDSSVLTGAAVRSTGGH